MELKSIKGKYFKINKKNNFFKFKNKNIIFNKIKKIIFFFKILFVLKLTESIKKVKKIKIALAFNKIKKKAKISFFTNKKKNNK